MWNNRNVWILMAGEGIAGFGMWFGMIGNLEFLQHTLPSDFMKAMILMTGPLFGFLIGPFAGRLIDQHEKKRVMFWAGVARLVATAFMFLALEMNSVLWMLCYSILTGLAAAFYFPSLQALIPRVVPQEHLISANGLNMNIATLSRIIGTAAAGIMLLKTSLYTLYWIAMTGYVFLLICNFFLQVDEQPKKAADGRKSGANKSGFKEVLPIIKSRPAVVMTLVLTLVPTLFIAAFNLMVIALSELLADNTIKSWLYTTEGVALMVGSYFARRIVRKGNGNLLPLMIFCTAMFGVAELVMFLFHSKVSAVFGFGLCGLMGGLFFPMVSTLFQTTIPRDYHGRFFSFRGMLDRLLFQIVMLAAGFFLDTIGFAKMVLVFALITFAVVLYAGWKQLRSPLNNLESSDKPSAPSA
jgi:MFS transporter, DHA3 family, macrolide efflux protein